MTKKEKDQKKNFYRNLDIAAKLSIVIRTLVYLAKIIF